MWRVIKLLLNFFFSSILFNYFVQILILLLNPHISIRLTSEEFFLLYLNLYIFYGPLWFILIGIIFALIQFFSEKKYPIGIFKPPTITYFLAFTILIISFILYLNYDYYFDFLEGHTKFNFVRIVLINLALVIIGIVFVFYKKIKKKWMQVVFLSLLAINIFHSYNSVITGNGDSGPDQFLYKNKDEKFSPPRFIPAEFTPRKIRIVIMDGLSLDLIQSLASEQKLLNFNEIIKKGVSGRIKTFRPNLSLSMLNSALTGLKPSEFSLHSHDKFKFTDINHEFDMRPRFIFFRKSPYINTTSFYTRNDNQFLDNINKYYENDKRKTVRIIKPPHIDSYSQRSLYKNNRFVPLFSDLLREKNKGDEKYEVLKKYFFLDDYLKNMIPDLKDSNTFYSVSSLPGLGIVGKFVYQYHMPQIFGDISLDDDRIKKYGWLIEKYYEYYDSIIGNLVSTTGDDELLVILSFFEYEPLPVWRRILVNLFGPKDTYVYKSLNSRGTILMYEKNALKNGYPLKMISVYDIYPTLLYYSGFQLSKDLRGEVLKEIFIDEFLLNNPIDIDTGYDNLIK